MNDSMKHTVKDSVFTMLFEEPENVMDLYHTIHPEDDTITQEEIQTITLETALVESVYNDLGLQVRDMLIVLAEAQSIFSPNIDYRMLLYLCETIDRYVKAHKMSRYSTKSIKFPRPELFVIYTGTKDVPPVIRLSDHFSDRMDDPESEAERQKVLRKKYGWIEVEVPVIRRTNKGDVLDQYIRFCEIIDEMRKKYGGTIEAVKAAIAKCLEEGILVKFLSSRQMEVEMSMKKLFDAEEAIRTRENEIRDEESEKGIRALIATVKKFSQSKDTAIQTLMEQFGMLPQIAADKVSRYW